MTIARVQRMGTTKPTMGSVGARSATAPVAPRQTAEPPATPTPVSELPASQQEVVATELAKPAVTPVVPGFDASRTLDQAKEVSETDAQVMRFGPFEARYDSAAAALDIRVTTDAARKGVPKGKTGLYHMTAPDGTRLTVFVLKERDPEPVQPSETEPVGAGPEDPAAAELAGDE